MSRADRLREAEKRIRSSKQKYPKVWLCHTVEQLAIAESELKEHQARGLRGRIVEIRIADMSAEGDGEGRLLTRKKYDAMMRQP